MGRDKSHKKSRFELPELLADFMESLKHPEFWVFSAWLDIITRFRRSRLGIVWMFLNPAAYIYGIGFFYAGISRMDPVKFIPFMGLGYLLWRFVTQVLSDSAGVMLAHRAYIMDGRVRLSDYVLRTMSKAFLYFATAFFVLVFALFASPDVKLTASLSLLVTLPVFLLNLFWIGIVLSLLGARFPDMHELTSTIFIFGFLLTPIIWYPESVPPGSVRALIVHLNPAYHLMEIVRAPLLGRPLGHYTLIYLFVMTVAGWGLAIRLYRRYARFVPLWL